MAALFLDFAEMMEGFLELAGEARAVERERGQRRDEGLGVGVLGEQGGFEEWDAVETPGGVGDFVDQLSFGGSGGSVLIDELLDVAPVGFGGLGGQDGGLGSETVPQGGAGGTLFALFGARTGGVEGVGAVGGGATHALRF